MINNHIILAQIICSAKKPYQCVDGQCIAKLGICDGAYDCTDGSDESNCSKWSLRLKFNISLS